MAGFDLFDSQVRAFAAISSRGVSAFFCRRSIRASMETRHRAFSQSLASASLGDSLFSWQPKEPSAPKAKGSPEKGRSKKAAAAKPAPKSTATKSKAAGPREQAVRQCRPLKLVDEAAALLRKGIRTSADTTEKSRHDAKKKAHDLLNKASSSLGDLLSGSTSALRSVLDKI